MNSRMGCGLATSTMPPRYAVPMRGDEMIDLVMPSILRRGHDALPASLCRALRRLSVRNSRYPIEHGLFADGGQTSTSRCALTSPHVYVESAPRLLDGAPDPDATSAAGRAPSAYVVSHPILLVRTFRFFYDPLVAIPETLRKAGVPATLPDRSEAWLKSSQSVLPASAYDLSSTQSRDRVFLRNTDNSRSGRKLWDGSWSPSRAPCDSRASVWRRQPAVGFDFATTF